ncbi:MAG TPA: DcaP family trimeric outer membrane transporter [Candidatus Didemnitutus sp.]|nr:DcaP family trimeric outer membrane transporter [Candidatus Didemnitutus sp.]
MKTPKFIPRYLACAIFAGAAVLPLGAPSARAQSADEIAQLKAMIEQLQKTVAEQNARIAELEKHHPDIAATTAAAAAVAANSPSQKTIEKVATGGTVGKASQVDNRSALNDQQEAAGRPKDYTLDPNYKGFIPVPNTAVLLKINAKPHVDMIYDNKNAGNHNRFVPAVFPLQGSSGYSEDGEYHMTANATQIRVDVRAPDYDDGSFRFYYQNDFFGSGSDTGDMKYRVQHLYGQLRGFKAGFTYGTWEDPDSWPDTVDYEGPNAVIFSRRPVAQYTQTWSENWNATYGIEKPDIYVDTASGPHAGGSQFTYMPDFGMNIRYEKTGFGHLQFSGTLRGLGAHDSLGNAHHVMGWGVNASAVINVGDSVTLQALGVVGEGVGGMGNDTSFLNSDAAFNSLGELEAMPYWSIHLASTFKWDKKTRSTITYGYVNLDNATGQAATFYHESTYASANLIWQLRPQWSLGVEGLYGIMKARNGVDSGDHYRIQLGMVYSIFP